MEDIKKAAKYVKGVLKGNKSIICNLALLYLAGDAAADKFDPATMDFLVKLFSGLLVGSLTLHGVAGKFGVKG